MLKLEDLANQFWEAPLCDMNQNKVWNRKYIVEIKVHKENNFEADFLVMKLEKTYTFHQSYFHIQ